MNKEQSADDPPWIWFVVKICLIAPFLWVTPDVVIACIEHKVLLEAFRAIEAALVKHDNMKDYSGGWLITITANHSNYLVCDRANTQSVTVKVVKLQLNYCNALVIKWIYNIVLFGGRTRDVHSSSLLIDVYALFFWLGLRRQASMTQAEKFPDPFLLKSDVNLFNHLVRKADVAGCCSAGSVLRWHEVAPYSVSLICIVWSCFYVKLMQIN